jgi:hypothetical protein
MEGVNVRKAKETNRFEVNISSKPSNLSKERKRKNIAININVFMISNGLIVIRE